MKCRTGFFFALLQTASAGLFAFPGLPYGSDTVAPTGWSTFSPRPGSKNPPCPRAGHTLTYPPSQGEWHGLSQEVIPSQRETRGRFANAQHNWGVQCEMVTISCMCVHMCARVCTCVCVYEQEVAIVNEFMKQPKGTLTTIDCK